MINDMLQYSLEVGICWAILYLVYIAFLKRETFFFVNRWYLLGSLVLGLIIPVLRMIPTAIQEEVYIVNEALHFISAGPELIASNIASPTPEKVVFISLSTLLLVVYCIGHLFFGLRFVRGISRIFKLYTSGQKTNKETFTLVETNEFHLPFSFLNCVFFSKELPLNDDVEKILKHELTHIESWHTLDILFIEFLQVVFWFNPLIYLYKKAIKDSHEYIADATVLEDTSQKIYGQILLRQSQSGLQISLANHFFQSHIKKRIKMMTQKKSKRPALLKYLVALPMILLLAILFQSQGMPTTSNSQQSLATTADNCQKTPLSLVEGEEVEVTYTERGKYKGVEIIGAEKAVEKFGEKAIGRCVFNLLDTEDYVLNTNKVKSRFYNKNGEWRFSYTSEERGTININIKDKDFKPVKSTKFEKTTGTLDFAISELGSPTNVFQLIVGRDENSSISTGIIDFNTGLAHDPLMQFYIVPTDQLDLPIYDLIKKAKDTPHKKLKSYFEAYDIFKSTNENNGRSMMLINKKSEEVQYIHPSSKELKPTLIPIRKEHLKKNIEKVFGFGERNHPIHKVNKHHRGIDLIADMYTPVYATGDGVVIVATYRKGYGKHITIEHNGSYRTLYAHMSSYNVEKGDKISKGQEIGKVGSTGLSTAPHLHYEVQKNGAAIDPMPFFKEYIKVKDTGSNSENVGESSLENSSFGSKCIAGDNGVSFWSPQIPPHLYDCKDIADEEERYTCTNDGINNFFLDRLQFPEEGIRQGFQGRLIYMLMIDEQGKIEKIQVPKNMTEPKFGYHQEALRIVEIMKDEIQFTPAECDGQKVRSWRSFSPSIVLTDAQKKKVIVKNSETVDNVIQSINLRGASSDGHIGFNYSTNMNVPLTINIYDANGKTVYTRKWDYIYKQTHDGVHLDKPINGTYRITAEQDGLVAESHMDINIFNTSE